MDAKPFLATLVALTIGCSSTSSEPHPQTSTPTTLPSEPGDSGTPAPSTSDAGAEASDAAADANDAGISVAECVKACEAKHPTGADLGRAIDACWAASCAVCNGIGTGHLEGPTTGTCATAVKTPSAACSTCTVQLCCAAWDACFTDADCVALNACSNACDGGM